MEYDTMTKFAVMQALAGLECPICHQSWDLPFDEILKRKPITTTDPNTYICEACWPKSKFGHIPIKRY